MDDLPGLQVFRDRFLKGQVIDEVVTEFLPLLASFLPTSQRTQTAQSRAAWRAYVATEAGALHARWLERRDADPDTAVTPEDARVIVRPLLDPARTAPVLSGPRIARHWLTLQEADSDKREMLRSFIPAAAMHPAFHEAVTLIAMDELLAGDPLSPELRVWIASVLEGKKPAGRSGRPKNTKRDSHIFAALLVLQHLGLNPTVNETRDRKESGCSIVAAELCLSYEAIATVWGHQRRNLRDASPLA